MASSNNGVPRRTLRRARTERRRRNRRADAAWRCQKCGSPDEQLRGHPAIGVQLVKCGECGIMDRRLPGERRADWSRGQLGKWRGSLSLVEAASLVTLMLAATLAVIWWVIR